jgi:hypothetical protein
MGWQEGARPGPAIFRICVHLRPSAVSISSFSPDRPSMNANPLRTTAVNPAERVTRAAFNPTRIFVDKDRLAWFWFIVAILILVGAGVDRFFLIKSLKEQEHVVIIDPAGTHYVSPLIKFEEAKDLHAQQSTLATLAFLNRNPKGFDHPGLLKQMFLKNGHDKAQNQRLSEEPEFKSKQLHQKAEIARIDILKTREEDVLTQVTGQLIRHGIFQERAFTEAIPFKLSFKLQRNPNMVQNGRFPTAVRDFKYEPSR